MIKAMVRAAAVLALLATVLAPIPAQAATPVVPEAPPTVIYLFGPPSVQEQARMALALSDCNPQLVCTFWNTNFGNPHYDYAIGWVPVGPGCREIGEPWDNDISSIYNRLSYDTHWHFQHGCMFNAIGNFDVAPNTAVSFGSYYNDKFSSFNRCPMANFDC